MDIPNGIKRKQNLIIIADYGYIDGGAHKVAINTAKIMSNHYNVYYYTIQSKEGQFSQELLDACIQIITPYEHYRKNLFRQVYDLKVKKHLSQFLKGFSKYETIIHIHTWGRRLSPSAIDVCGKLGFSTLITLHDYLSVCPNGALFNYRNLKTCGYTPLSKQCITCNCIEENYIVKLGKTIRFIFQSHAIKKWGNIRFAFVSSFSEVIMKKTNQSLFRNRKTYLLPNPIDDNLTKNNKRVQCEKNECALYIGNLEKHKGIDVFCEAVSQLNIKSYVLGGGPRLYELKEKYPKVIFCGFVTQSDIIKYFDITRLFIFPSLCYETLGLSLVEAMTKGIPVLVASNTAASSFVENYKNGIIFQNGNIADLKEKIEILYQDDQTVERISKNIFLGNLDMVISQHQYEQQLNKIYNDLLIS